ncbi:ricin B-like lectin, partial [Cutaneotrichosporon oleaginosum]
VFIHPNGNRAKCIDVVKGKLAPGTPVQIWDCDPKREQRFLLARGNGQIKVPGTDLCLEALERESRNGCGVTLERCNRSLRQLWYYTNDNRIAVTDSGFCLDLPNGKTHNGNLLQVWQCINGNTNQVWTTTPVGVPF